MAIEIDYPKGPGPIKVDAKMRCALSHATFEEGLNWLMIDEHERALEAFQKRGTRETCFLFLINHFTKLWQDK